MSVIYEGEIDPAYLQANSGSPMRIGERYNVLCIRATSWEKEGLFWVPVFGEPHWDLPETKPKPAETAGFMHIHLDYRFLTIEEMIAFPSQQTAIMLMDRDGKWMDATRELSYVLRWEVRVYARKWSIGVFPPRHEFERRYSKCVLPAKTAICPHQGFDLRDVEPIDIDGVKQVICPGHALRWRCSDGCLIRSGSRRLQNKDANHG